MKLKFTIGKDGSVVTEVIDREGSDCKQVYKLTERLGQTTGEEITGPDCDTAIETTID
jgi:hypothetical protein